MKTIIPHLPTQNTIPPTIINYINNIPGFFHIYKEVEWNGIIKKSGMGEYNSSELKFRSLR